MRLVSACMAWLGKHGIYMVVICSSEFVPPFAYSHFVYLLPLGAISPTHAKCDQNNVKLLKQAYDVH